MLCSGYKWFGHPRVYIPTILDHQKEGESTDMLDDHGLVKAFAKEFNSADYHVTWYGDRFDLPFIRTKLLKYGEPPLMNVPSIDLWWTARKKFKLHNNRPASWQEYLETDHNKTPIHFGDWRRAAFGNKAALERIVSMGGEFLAAIAEAEALAATATASDPKSDAAESKKRQRKAA